MNEILGRIFHEGVFRPGRLQLKAGRIATIDWSLEVARGAELPLVAPGLVDLHVHGFGGFEPLESLAGMARALALAGTTAFQPTLFPKAPSMLGQDAAHVSVQALNLPQVSAGRFLGLHLEGPFVNPSAAGALPRDCLAVPSPAALAQILGPSTAGGRAIRTLTVAPELPGARALMAEALRAGIRISLGHSQAKAGDARAAVSAGATGITHLYNAMSALHHREAGLVGVALSSTTPYAEIIGDLVHVGADALRVALAARGPKGLCLVSDALQGAGTGCDVFHARGYRHIVRDGAAFYAPENDANEPKLAGSASSQLEMVRKLVSRGVLSIEDALTMASSTPARALGLEHEIGHIAVGAKADLILLDAHDLSLRQVLVGGSTCSS